MSKKHSKQHTQSAAPLNPVAASSPVTLSHAGEYRIIKHDLLRVVALNVIYLAAVLVLYYTNQKSHYLDSLLGNWLHF